MGRRRLARLCIGLIFLLAVLTGCSFEKVETQRVEDLDYTVCEEASLPDALVELIQEKRKSPFKLTYRTKDYIYIVVGYGAQDRSDLGVTVTQLYLAENSIVVDTDLISKEDTTLAEGKVSYPWIAVKVPYYDLQVVFQ